MKSSRQIKKGAKYRVDVVALVTELTLVPMLQTIIYDTYNYVYMSTYLHIHT